MNKLILEDFLSEAENSSILEVLPHMPYRLHGSMDEQTFLNSEVREGEYSGVFDTLVNKVLQIPDIDITAVQRVYVNLNPSGFTHSGKFHQDDGDITALYYPSTWNTDEQGGGTLFKEGTYIENVRNRLVVFEAKNPHRALEHSGKEPFRYSIAVKMTGTFK